MIVALVACGDNLVIVDSAATQSGSRLKLSWYQYADGARELASRIKFFDAVRDETCVAMPWTGGATYCTPGVISDFSGNRYARTVFTTADCTAKVGAAASPVSHFIEDELVNGQAHLSHYYRSGPVAKPQPRQTYDLRDGVCAGPFDVTGAFVYFELGLELPKSQLAEITRTELGTRSRLGFTVDTSLDGMRIWVGYYDHGLETTCQLEYREDSAIVCAPSNAYDVDYFRDAQCTQPTLSVASSRPEPRFATRHSLQTDCTSYFRVGSRVESPLFERFGEQCLASTAPLDERQYSVEEPLVLPVLELEYVETPGRRLQDVVGVHGDTTTPSVGLFDTVTGVRCRASGFSTDIRCMPTRRAAREAYTDSTCDTQQLVTELRTGSCDGPYDDFAQSQFEIYKIGAPVEATLYLKTTDARCVPYISPAGYTQFHLVGPPVTTEFFPPATLVVDP